MTSCKYTSLNQAFGKLTIVQTGAVSLLVSDDRANRQWSITTRVVVIRSELVQRPSKNKHNVWKRIMEHRAVTVNIITLRSTSVNAAVSLQGFTLDVCIDRGIWRIIGLPMLRSDSGSVRWSSANYVSTRRPLSTDVNAWWDMIAPVAWEPVMKFSASAAVTDASSNLMWSEPQWTATWLHAFKRHRALAGTGDSSTISKMSTHAVLGLHDSSDINRITGSCRFEHCLELSLSIVVLSRCKNDIYVNEMLFFMIGGPIYA